MRNAVILPHPVDWVQFTARGLGLLWAGFWTFFCVAAAIGERLPLFGAVMHVVPAAVFCAALAYAWRYERTGGALLAAIGILAFVFFRMHRFPVAAMFMLLPPAAAGILFVAHWRKRSTESQ